MEVTRNIIARFSGSWLSGIATLHFQDGSMVHGDSGPLGRALDAAFDCIAPGHCIDSDPLNGQDIVYTTDFVGIIEGFTPYDTWLDSGPEIEIGQTITIE